MKTPRDLHCAFAMDSSIFVCGGLDHGENTLSSVEQFLVNDSRGWVKHPGMKHKRFSSCYNFLFYLFYWTLWHQTYQVINKFKHLLYLFSIMCTLCLF